MKIHALGAECFLADRTQRHDEANSCFLAVLRTRLQRVATDSHYPSLLNDAVQY